MWFEVFLEGFLLLVLEGWLKRPNILATVLVSAGLEELGYGGENGEIGHDFDYGVGVRGGFCTA